MAWIESGYKLGESFKIAAKNANAAAIGTGFVEVLPWRQKTGGINHNHGYKHHSKNS